MIEKTNLTKPVDLFVMYEKMHVQFDVTKIVLKTVNMREINIKKGE